MAVTPKQLERIKRDIRIEQAARLTGLRIAAELVHEARYATVTCDGTDIFNCELERIEKDIRELLAVAQAQKVARMGD